MDDLYFYKNDKLKVVFFKEDSFKRIIYGYVTLGKFHYILKPIYSVKAKDAISMKDFIRTNEWYGNVLSYKELLNELKKVGRKTRNINL